MDVRDAIRNALSSALGRVGVSLTKEDVPLEHTADFAHGDYATGVALKYAKGAGMSPRELAEKVVAGLGAIDGVEKIEVAGAGFINFFLLPQALADSIERARADNAEEKWGANKINGGKKIMVEYTDPNPFKEFHIGHLMSNAIGESLARLLEFSGTNVLRANYQGDVGLHVAKTIWGKLQKTEASWGEAYVYGSEQYESNKEAIGAVNKLVYEKSDEKINTLYKDGRAESLEHFETLYKTLGTKFDHYFFESETGPLGVTLVRAHPEVFDDSEGATVFRGEKFGLHTRVFITSQGLPTYEAKDLGLAEAKKEKAPFDTSITVTASEQNDYFSVVLKALELVHPEWQGQFEHVSHGMMRFAEGKMSSRKGNVVTGESLLAELTEVARSRAKESRAEDTDTLAEQVAVAAVKYQVLKQQARKDIIFNREQALSLEGDSGPYLQYAHARACAVVEKAKAEGVEAKVNENAEPQELARLLHRFPEVVERAARERESRHVTTYILTLAGAFNRWYANEQIVDGSPEAPHKVALTDAVRATLKNGLWLLGIPSPDKM
ncbi:arginine--tRNA ligase [Candidatus Kaiserbacteria bacterium RIFCSPHIGHO2_01_FULL_50_13]|uniref:Arginine--tRNA ligase n=1 Tax=Candidatus Kaiserbacteria bacterium RIFCSPLOWO2_01_FULL_50_24 TaxID=1798507 RepID=A0A1F6ER46_9BACT|nr:MAG: arginine--tRNA ligase [Candidatus Kaiserbacteria bacterium RIFCSPHIGHO2_01_FULL_50_13]OGG76079.1 MAG: arginine--tRNA ligase [Candidatus Kaiserbacteria bacterium RIFCSPLOWO2_01_FULL_50_24]OGG81706.1 MAG: arginine--tRNA ligase [Candidatus Kaiserbacteria bacterium RIFCSPLOWO2_02_FULL_51_13]